VTLTLEDVRHLDAVAGERRGWDFSRMRTDRDPVPWEYADVVRRYLRPTDRVLDVGTGGGERFLRFIPHAAAGVGIDRDPEMIRVARENTPPALAAKIAFEVMDAAALAFPGASFDVVLDRHCGADPAEVARVLRPGGYFVAQQVGGRNTRSVLDAFGWGPAQQRRAADRERRRPPHNPAGPDGPFARAGCAVVASGEYEVRYFYRDVESLVFHLKAVLLPEPFDPERHWRPLAAFVAAHRTPRGLETNEHRTLLVVRKHDAPG
jgi:SAM-dependent methyltransferase